MLDIAQAKLQQLVSHDACRIAEAEQTVIREHSMQAHRPRVQ